MNDKKVEKVMNHLLDNSKNLVKEMRDKSYTNPIEDDVIKVFDALDWLENNKKELFNRPKSSVSEGEYLLMGLVGIKSVKVLGDLYYHLVNKQIKTLNEVTFVSSVEAEMNSFKEVHLHSNLIDLKVISEGIDFFKVVEKLIK